MKSKLPITSWSDEDRPREKLMAQGATALSMAELLAILIGSGNRNESAVSLCQRILADHQQKLENISQLSVHELITYAGIGEAKAVTIVAALELGRRRISATASPKVKLNSSQSIFDHIHHKLLDKSIEECWLIYLNRGLIWLGEERIGIGGQAGVLIDPKVVFKKALDRKASSIVLIHNHPSGQLKPSRPDLDITKKIVATGQNLDLPLLDHLIVTNHGYYSFKDEGLI